MTGTGLTWEAIRFLGPALSEFKVNEGSIGTAINEALLRTSRTDDALGACPVCETGEIRIITSKQTGKRFAGCTNYFPGSCDTSYPLPQKGKIQTMDRKCSVCGAPRIRVLRRRKRPWDLCINLNCPSKRKEDPADG